GALSSPSLVARRVGDLQIGIYASPGYLAGVGVPSHPAELAQPQHRVVSFQRTFSGKAAPLHLRRGSEQVSVEGRYIVAVDDGNACLSAGLAGLGALWLPRYMADRHVERGELAALFPDWAVDSMPLHVVYAPHRHVNARLRVFIEWVAELMSVHAPITSGPRPDAVPLAAAKRRRSTPRS
ncbi:MAG TPA: LysR substrate-binding domain-containing protein, partial [Burkholderiaceae bacterium]|nr:LysR substrate-binding domain-containing protein [Burkholderiaceae bacterium]